MSHLPASHDGFVRCGRFQTGGHQPGTQPAAAPGGEADDRSGADRGERVPGARSIAADPRATAVFRPKIQNSLGLDSRLNLIYEGCHP